MLLGIDIVCLCLFIRNLHRDPFKLVAIRRSWSWYDASLLYSCIYGSRLNRKISIWRSAHSRLKVEQWEKRGGESSCTLLNRAIYKLSPLRLFPTLHSAYHAICFELTPSHPDALLLWPYRSCAAFEDALAHCFEISPPVRDSKDCSYRPRAVCKWDLLRRKGMAGWQRLHGSIDRL